MDFVSYWNILPDGITKSLPITGAAKTLVASDMVAGTGRLDSHSKRSSVPYLVCERRQLSRWESQWSKWRFRQYRVFYTAGK